ncbi:MAG: DUF2946 family protein [Ottowia sp.]|nr:DUF2946 family protein [Ottowia sp.]
MDEIVRQAMAKWPDVPDCYGWLGLGARGDWYLRDAQVQACGPFASGKPGARGARLVHEALLSFIGRNYAADARGCWFFQNGPQRVYVELDVAPWIWRVDENGVVTSHTQQPASLRQVLTDELGRVFLQTGLGFGLVHTQDVGRVADLIESGRWQQPKAVAAETLPSRFGYEPSPQRRAELRP